MDMKSVLKDVQSVKNAVNAICKFVGVEMDSEYMDQYHTFPVSF